MRTFKKILCILVISSFGALNALTAQSNTAFIDWEGQVIEVFTDHIEVHFEDERFRDTVAVRLSMDIESLNFYDRQRGFAVMHIEEGMDIHTVIAKVRAINGVAKVGPSVVMRAKTVPNDTHFNLQYGPVITNMPLAWDITTGDAIVLVGVIDSGIPLQQNTTNLSHEDLDNGARILLGNDYSHPQEGIRDLFGHGTHVTGILSAETDNGKGIAGSSWHNQILVVKFFNEQGGGTPQNFYNAVKYAVDEGVDIINFSGGATADPLGTIENAVQYAYNNNVLLVAAAGNYDQQSNPNRVVEYPAAYSAQYSNVIAVSATNNNDEVPFFSSRGPEVNLSAPGDNIYSTTPDYSVSGDYELDYDYDTGTSMSAPHVAGTAALMLSVNPSLTPSDIRTTLQLSADKVPGMGGQNFTNEYGHGRLNAYEAVKYALPLQFENHQFTESITLSDHAHIYGNTQISSGVTINVPAGVVAIISGNVSGASNAKLNVFGRLNVEPSSSINGVDLAVGSPFTGPTTPTAHTEIRSNASLSNCDIVIWSNGVMSLATGVTASFGSGQGIIAYGGIGIIGGALPGSQVTLKSTGSKNVWNGVHIHGGGSLENVIIEQAVNGVSFYNTSDISMRDVTVMGDYENLYTVDGIRFINSTFIDPSSSTRIRAENLWKGLYFDGGYSEGMGQLRLEANGQTGFWVDGAGTVADVFNSCVWNGNHIGLYANDDSYLQIYDSSIYENQTDAQAWSGSVIDAGHNYWGPEGPVTSGNGTIHTEPTLDKGAVISCEDPLLAGNSGHMLISADRRAALRSKSSAMAVRDEDWNMLTNEIRSVRDLRSLLAHIPNCFASAGIGVMRLLFLVKYNHQQEAPCPLKNRYRTPVKLRS